MRAAYIETLGPPEVIRYGELPAPRPGPTDVLVDVLATPVNPVDTLIRSGAFATPTPFPFVVGRDAAGTVAAAGEGAPGFAPGDRVWCNSLGHEGRQGAAAEQVAVAADRLYHLPDGVDPETAAALAHPGVTAYLALFTHGRLGPGETVLVGGAAGNVGGAAVALAARAGARVLATARRDDADHCRSLGADTVLDYRDPELPRRIGEAAPEGVDVFLDTSGVNDLPEAVGLLAHRGRIVLMSGFGSRPALPAGALYSADRSVIGFAISNATTAELAEAAVVMNVLLAEGRLRPRAVETAPLSDAAEAHRRMEEGLLRGKRLVLRP
ncbi:NADPH:quinone reductase [Streptomyces sp. NPDC048639]|uniref:NADPH:quinone reductase n=1 Tax=Streptomyces sp. NPDC048639 TaxID=3365581 RepID=UPI003722C9A7